MIKLSTAAQARFSNLKVPPTHAVLASQTTQHGHDTAYDVVGLTLAYWFGSLDANGRFVPDPTLGTVVVQVPTPETIAKFTRAGITTVLAGLYGAGVAPNPTDVTTTMAVPTKHRNDFKMQDLHRVAMHFEPFLDGTIVNPASAV